ncbi:MAG: carbohydrate-binding domain-containing protein [Candidatus Bathyarchaeota archaeon]|nr:carbohydrate-binding domain-containing protein [Candidatus Termiticorpusculum sp.]
MKKNKLLTLGIIATVIILLVILASYTLFSSENNAEWGNTYTKINLNGESASVEGSGAIVNENVITITEAGVYVVSGTLTNGQIIVDATNQDKVQLVLNGTDITNPTGAAIYAPQCDKLTLTIANGTTNTVTDGGNNYIPSASNESNAAIFVKDDLTINGKGTLIVNAGFNNGIGTQDNLFIESGNIIINAANHGLFGNDSVTIIDGDFEISAGNDGIQTDSASKGWVLIEGGTFNITTVHDGIQAETDLTITGGAFTITTGGGSVNAPEKTGDIPGGRQQSIEEEEMGSMKALKAKKLLTISGGDFIIDSVDDGIHSNGDVFITGGKFSIKTGDDGIHADNAVEISCGEIYIPVCYEGIEGLTVTISGGNISIVASDDGINAADGENSGAMVNRPITEGGQMGLPPPDGSAFSEMPGPRIDNGTGGPMTGGPNFQTNPEIGRQPGEMPLPPSGANTPVNTIRVTEGAFIRITGGTIDIYAGKDGLDSNNMIYLEGGTVTINGPSLGMDGAVDMDGEMIITGGELVAVGSVTLPSQNSTQPSILVSFTKEQVSGSVITIKDSSGNIILEYTSKVNFSASGFTSSSFKIGETYSLFINGEKRVDITLNDVITSINDDGGAYNARGGINIITSPSGVGRRPQIDG